MVVNYFGKPGFLVSFGGVGILLSAAALGVVHERISADQQHEIGKLS
jgi:hypothetical protein